MPRLTENRIWDLLRDVEASIYCGEINSSALHQVVDAALDENRKLDPRTRSMVLKVQARALRAMKLFYAPIPYEAALERGLEAPKKKRPVR